MTTLLPLLALCLLAQEKPREIKSPITPEQALAEFKVRPGLRVELVASEPEVQSPVAACFDERGRLFVVEMLDYPIADPSKPPQGRIKMLEDKDGDGRYETATVFAEGLLMAQGVTPWKGGILVTQAPNVLFLKDTRGDGKADVKETLYSGFAVENPQLRVSHPQFAMDNGIYVANGQRGGKIKSALHPDAAPIDINGMDFRFDLVHDRAEAVTGFGQFGLTFDDRGHRFVCTNRNHVIPIVIPNSYFQRNPFLAAPPPVTDNQGPGGAARVYPISRNWTLTSAHSGSFTASCGVFIYRGDLLPKEYSGHVFTCEPTGNLIHEEELVSTGGSYGWKPPHEGVEFLASPDNWFRPVSMFPGPDGALYVIDMYRAEVEHPDWVPADLKNRYDFNHRRDQGRIWRIVPEGRRNPAPRPELAQASTEDLVALLGHPDVWWRMTAQRLLVERQDRDAWGPLRKMIARPDPLARLHAAWTLEGLQEYGIDVALRLLGDPDPGVRENAVRLAERWAGDNPVAEQLSRMADDPDEHVRWQVALSIGARDNDSILAPLTKIARARIDDKWTRLAVATAVPTRAGKLLALVQDPVFCRELAAIVGSRKDKDEVALVIRDAAQSEPRRQSVILTGLAEGMNRRSTRLGEFLGTLPEAESAKAILAKAGAVASDPARTVAERLDAIRLLVHVPWETAGPALAALLGEEQPSELRIAAVQALSSHGRREVSAILLGAWKKALPALRREILEAMSRRPERVSALLDEIEGGRMTPGELGASLLRRLDTYGDAGIRDRAKRLIASNLPEARQKVIDRYQESLGKKGDPKRGRDIFKATCTACHRIADLGTPVGPDISDTLTKAPEQLLVDILDPSRVIDNNYVTYVVRTKSGAVVSGFIASQTASSLTLRRGEGQEDIVLRQDIDEMKSSGISLMPEGLEKNISIEAMADLIAFLKGWRFIDAPERQQR
ncbi:MAG TPA: PVC-type heme-binding CxxCH protein [Planctomycetota bacterium]|nr:PVC-type heme-binding CxxCH protein [Planctomycetota bacterium]